MSSSSSSAAPDFRRKWDKDEYETMARKRIRLEEEEEEDRHRGPPVKRELLKQRDYKVDLDSKLSKSQVITKTTPLSQSGGYYCNVCDCVVKDSINFLDHINGKKHQRNLGMSMKVEKSTLDQVRKRFESNKKKLEEKNKEYNLDERLMELKEEDEKLKAYRREKKKDKKKKPEEEEGNGGGMDPDMAKMMGFGGFGGSRKNN